jgi:hypothetical protein
LAIGLYRTEQAAGFGSDIGALGRVHIAPDLGVALDRLTAAAPRGRATSASKGLPPLLHPITIKF